MSPPVLLLPGWQNSGPTHWQSLWEKAHGYQRVEQHDWMQPLRGDWIARLEDVLLSCATPSLGAVLVAHSLGCVMAAAWAAHTHNAKLVRAAFLVAPGDTERPDVRELLPSWSPIPMRRLPFPSILCVSRDDPYCGLKRSLALGQAWGSEVVDLGNRGHINADSGLGDWPDGHAMLVELISGQRSQGSKSPVQEKLPPQQS